jgi:hypothetical protein
MPSQLKNELVKKNIDRGTLEEALHRFSCCILQVKGQRRAKEPYKIDKAPKRLSIGNT